MDYWLVPKWTSKLTRHGVTIAAVVNSKITAVLVTALYFLFGTFDEHR